MVSSLFLIALATLSSQAPQARAQAVTGTFPPVPLASKVVSWDAIPYKVDTDTGLIRGTQHGYNICNSTTENQDSLCQTSVVNSLDDFCLWAPSEPDSVVANTEGEMVAWCTKPGRGTRLIPEGALQGVQFIKTPDYISLVGFINQEMINIQREDWGGEMDPHGADLRGNPMGGLMFSNAFTGEYVQVVEWHNFMGGNAFCLKACDPAGPNAAHFCEHVFDRIGCAYNVPSNAANGTFESCLGENQDFPGVFVDEAGTTQTYTQPPESLGPIGQPTYTARVPSSSECRVFESGEVYKGLPVATNVVEPTLSGMSISGSKTFPGGVKPTTTTTSTGGAGGGDRGDRGDSEGSARPVGVSFVGLAIGLVGSVGVGFVGVVV